MAYESAGPEGSLEPSEAWLWLASIVDALGHLPPAHDGAPLGDLWGTVFLMHIDGAIGNRAADFMLKQLDRVIARFGYKAIVSDRSKARVVDICLRLSEAAERRWQAECLRGLPNGSSRAAH